MIKKISDFFTTLQSSLNVEEPKDPLSLELSCVVLLCEVMRADGVMTQDEQVHLAVQVEKQFKLPPQEALELIEKACHLSEQAIDFHQFTSIINQQYQAPEKVTMVSLLWQLAFADGKIDNIEEHIIRRIADLLHLSRAEYIQAKNTVISPN